MKTYQLSNHDGWEALVRIDESHPKLEAAIRQMVEFWGDWEHRLRLCKGDYTKAFLQQLGETIQVLSHIHSVEGVADELENMEGWYPVDGSVGVTLMSCDEFVFPDVYVKEVAA